MIAIIKPNNYRWIRIKNFFGFSSFEEWLVIMQEDLDNEGKSES